jgi:hypothetical protein
MLEGRGPRYRERGVCGFRYLYYETKLLRLYNVDVEADVPMVVWCLNGFLSRVQLLNCSRRASYASAP